VLLVIAIETVGAVCVLLGMWTRMWATAMAVYMAVTIIAIKLPHHANFELEALLLAGAVTLMALGDGPLSIGIRFKNDAPSGPRIPVMSEKLRADGAGSRRPPG